MKGGPLGSALFLALMEPASATTASGTTPADAGPLRQLLREHRFPEALAAAQALLAQAPAERDALLCAAIAQRFLGRIPAALSTLATLEAQHPRFSRLYEERGRCFVEQRQAQPAIEAFLKAVNLNHALPGSWGMLEGLYRMRGDAGNAATAAGQVRTLRGLPQEVVVATGLFADGDLEAAEALVRAYLLKHGDHIEAMRLLARIGIAHKVFFDAQVLLAAVLERAPEYRAARQEYAFVLIEMHRYQEARRELELLLPAEPRERGPEDAVRRQLCRPGRARTGDRPLPGAARRLARGCRGTPLDRPCAEDPRAERGGGRLLPPRRRVPAGFRGRLLEPCEPEDVPLHGRGTDAAARGARRAGHAPGGSLPSVFRARQGARGPRRVRASPSATTSAATSSSAPSAAIARN